MDNIHASVGYLLNTSARLIKRNLDLLLNEYNITTSQWAVLKLLANQQVMTQAQIAEALNSDRATCGSVIERLHKKNMIVKTENKNDRRAYDISLSNQGEEIIQTLTHLADESNNQVLSGLSDKDIETLCKLLNCIIDNLEDK